MGALIERGFIKILLLLDFVLAKIVLRYHFLPYYPSNYSMNLQSNQLLTKTTIKYVEKRRMKEKLRIQAKVCVTIKNETALRHTWGLPVSLSVYTSK